MLGRWDKVTRKGVMIELRLVWYLFGLYLFFRL